MKRSLAILAVFLLCSSIPARGEETPAEQRDRENNFIKELSYRQREYQSQYIYLSDKESKSAAELNDEITRQNQSPSAISLQRVENLRMKIIENLQDQIKNDRDYIRYLEMRLSELVDYKFPTIKAVQELDRDTIPPVNSPPIVLDKASVDATGVPEESKSAVAPLKPEEPKPEASPAKPAIQPYKRERIPLSIEESPASPKDESQDMKDFRQTQEELNRLHDESLKPQVSQDY